MKMHKTLFALAIASTLNACVGGEIHVGTRSTLAENTEHQGQIAPAGSIDRNTAGLWVRVQNQLPVIRHNDEVISQAFLEGSLSGKNLSPEAKTRRLRSGASTIEGITYVLDARVLSEREQLFYLAPAAVDELVRADNGEVRFEVRDSVQWSNTAYPCARAVLRPSSEAPLQKITFKVTGRNALSFVCEVVPGE